MVTLLIAASFVTFITTDNFEVESCIGEKFQLIESTQIKYPTYTHPSQSNQSGYVDLKVYANADGQVSTVNVIRAQPKRLFNKGARRAVKRWKFNKSIHTERCFNVIFKLNENNAQKSN